MQEFRWLPEDPTAEMVRAAHKDQPDAIQIGFARAYRTMFRAAQKVQHPAIPALRALAIVPTQKPGVQAVIHDGHRCRVCASTWKLKQPEQHQEWCALKETA
jgi:hypothetical protein